jgi:cobalamin synthase
MDALSRRSLLIVASLQASIALAASLSSPTAVITAAAIGVLAVGRYFAVACFAATLGSRAKALLHLLASSAWVFGMIALAAAVAVVALKARRALPWAVAATLAGPFGMSALAFGTGLGALVSGRAGRQGGKA